MTRPPSHTQTALHSEILKPDLIEHELLTPIATILGFSRLILEEKNIPPDREEFAGIIRNQAQQLKHCATAMVDLSRAASGRLEILPCPGDISQQIRIISHIVLEAHSENRDLLDIDVPDHIPTAVFDPTRLEFVLYHLLNAVLTWDRSTGRRTLSLRGGETVHRVDIGNSELVKAPEAGEPIQDVLLIKRYCRIGGIGFQVARHIIEEGHGGKLWLRTDPELGNVFTFTLPGSASPAGPDGNPGKGAVKP